MMPKTAEVIKIPVGIKCSASVPVAPELKYSPPYTELFKLVQDLKGDRLVMLAYEGQLKSALESCLVE
jgi:hypothetical protein